MWEKQALLISLFTITFLSMDILSSYRPLTKSMPLYEFELKACEAAEPEAGLGLLRICIPRTVPRRILQHTRSKTTSRKRVWGGIFFFFFRIPRGKYNWSNVPVMIYFFLIMHVANINTCTTRMKFGSFRRRGRQKRSTSKRKHAAGTKHETRIFISWPFPSFNCPAQNIFHPKFSLMFGIFLLFFPSCSGWWFWRRQKTLRRKYATYEEGWRLHGKVHVLITGKLSLTPFESNLSFAEQSVSCRSILARITWVRTCTEMIIWHSRRRSAWALWRRNQQHGLHLADVSCSPCLLALLAIHRNWVRPVANWPLNSAN